MQIHYGNPDSGLHYVLRELNKREKSIREDSRNGPVIRFKEPVILVNENPADRVSMSPIRDANPFFHFMEALWMLGGMNELAPMAVYLPGLAQYSDDGETLRGTAYGHKWRSYFGYDQLALAIRKLIVDPTDRRIVMTMWDPRSEWLHSVSKDLSCNLQVIFSTRPNTVPGGRRILDMTVTNRSNDIVYGCLGSNVFHFSFLQEYVASHTDLELGCYYQIANNLHGYLDNPAFKKVWENPSELELSLRGTMTERETMLSKYVLSTDPRVIANFVRTGDPGEDAYLKWVGQPIYEAWRFYKMKDRGVNLDKSTRIEIAQQIVSQCADSSLAIACVNWLGRRTEPPAVLSALLAESMDFNRNERASGRPITIEMAERPE